MQFIYRRNLLLQKAVMSARKQGADMNWALVTGDTHAGFS
jgi:hypothetical protein